MNLKFFTNLFAESSDTEKAEFLASIVPSEDDKPEATKGTTEETTDMTEKEMAAFTAKFDAMEASLAAEKDLRVASDAKSLELEKKIQAYAERSGNDLTAKGAEFADTLITAKFFAPSAKKDLSGLFVALSGDEAPKVNDKPAIEVLSALFAKGGPAELASAAFGDGNAEKVEGKLTLLGQKQVSIQGEDEVMSEDDIKEMAAVGASGARR